MSLKVFGMACNVLIISAMAFLTGCSSKPTSMMNTASRIDPEGTKEEQLAYHKAEIRKYKAAVSKEEMNANRYLSLAQMNDVRQANSRKQQYIKKIEEHVEAIEELQTAA